MDRTLFYNLGEDITEKTAEFIIRNFKNFDRVAVVSGGKRPSLFIKKHMFEKISEPFFPPLFFSTDEFTEYIAKKEFMFGRMTEIDACFFIYEILKDIKARDFFPSDNFPAFLPWAKEIISVLEQSWLEDIGEKTLLKVENLGAVGYQVPEKINFLLGSIADIRKRFRERMESVGKFTRGLTYLKACEIIAKLALDEFEAVLFCGLFSPCKTELEIIKTLHKTGKAVLFFQGDPRAWRALGKTLSEMRIPPPAPAEHPALPQVRLFKAFDFHSEAAAAGGVLRELENMGNTVIVLPEPSSMVPLWHEIYPHAGEANISAGYPLRRSMLFSLVSLIIKARNTSVNSGYYSEDYLGVLGHPFAKKIPAGAEQGASNIIIRKIEESLKGIVESSHSGRLFIEPSEIEDSEETFSAIQKSLEEEGIVIPAAEIKKYINNLHEVFFHRWKGAAGLFSFAGALEETVSFAVGNILPGENSLEAAAAGELLDLCDEMRCSRAANLRLSFEDAAGIFMDSAGARRITLPGTPLRGLQILGFLETRLLKFKNVIVMDLNEGSLPAANPGDPLVPAEILKILGIKDISREEETQRYHFRRLLAAAENVMLFYVSNGRKERSRFIEEIIWEEEKKRKALAPFPEHTAIFSMKAPPVEPAAAIEKTKEALFFLRSLQFSASSLNTYINCPLKFYFRYVQNLKESEDMLREPEGADVGRFLHEFLEETFKGFLGKKPVIDAEFRVFFHSYFKKFFEIYFKKRLGPAAFMLKRVMEHRLEKFIRFEERRTVKKILSLEDKLSGTIPAGNSEAGLTAIIDRTDETPESDILVIDYKSGAGDKLPSKSALEAPPMHDRAEIKKKFFSIQLPMYMLLSRGRYPGRRINSCLYNLRNARMDLLFREAVPAGDGVIEGFAATIQNIISEILNPGKPFEADPSGYSCKFCEYGALCGNPGRPMP